MKTYKNILLVGLLVTSLSACALPGARDIAIAGAKINDDVAIAALFSICKGISIGAWQRNFGLTQKLANAWAVMCKKPIVDNNVIPPLIGEI
jgi:hypothetical protein